MNSTKAFILAALSFLILIPGGVHAQGISIVSGNGQLLQEQFLSTTPLVVQIRDATGRPIAGAQVAWAVTQGSGTVVNQAGSTDGNGQASTYFLGTNLQLGLSFTPSQVTASSQFGSVSFMVTTALGRLPNGSFSPPPLVELIAPTLDNRSLSGPRGTILSGAVVVQVTAQSGVQAGQPVPNVSLRVLNTIDPLAPPPTACNGPGGVVLTNASGRATCDLVLNGSPGITTLSAEVGEYQITPAFNLTITQAPSCTFTLSSAGQPFGAAASTGSVNVAAASGCSWTAASNARWITIASAAGSANGAVVFNVSANPGALRSGTLLIAGQTYTVTQSAGAVGPSPLTIASAGSLPTGAAGGLYSITLVAAGGQPPYSWIIAGALPPGLLLNASTGVLSGIANTAGNYTFLAAVTDSLGASRSQTFAINIGTPSAGPVITNVNFPGGSVGQPYSQPVTSSGGCVSPFSPVPSVRLASGSLPDGLDIKSLSVGYAIAGTPATPGAFTFGLSVTDACGHSSTSNFAIAIGGITTPITTLSANPASLSFSAQQGNSSRPPDQFFTITAAGGAALTYSASTSSPWVTLGQTSGTIPGTLTVGVANISTFAPGSYNASITIAVPNANNSLTVPVTLTVLPAPVLTVTPAALTLRDNGQQALSLSSNGGGVHFTATAISSGNWLSVTPGVGDTPVTLTVRADTTALAPGSYNGAINIAQTGSAAIAVPVNLIVSLPPSLTVSPATLSFAYRQGGQLPDAKLVLVTSSGAPINFTTTADSWIVVNGGSGTTPSNVTVSVNPAGLAPGVYNSSVRFNSSAVTNISLTVTAPAPLISAVTNAASFAPGPLAPGEFITIFGSNIGPAKPAGLHLTDTGAVDNLVSDTRVLFDGTAAPMVYASDSQVSVIVPYEVSGQPSTQLQVEYKGVRSTPLLVRIVAASPAIFPGAILNQDSSLNTAQNGAEPSSIVVFYATGAGQTDPGGSTGNVTADVLPKPLLKVGVQIAGQSAEVLYAGAAPGLPSGVMQVNARIPKSTTLGIDAPVTLTVGDFASPIGVTVSIRP